MFRIKFMCFYEMLQRQETRKQCITQYKCIFVVLYFILPTIIVLYYYEVKDNDHPPLNY